MNFFGRWLVTTVAVMAAIWIVPGIYFVGGHFAAALCTALALAFVNTWIKPAVKFLSLPLTCLTLGIFALVVNAAMLELASWLARNLVGNGLVIESFGSAVFASIIISLITAVFGAGVPDSE